MYSLEEERHKLETLLDTAMLKMDSFKTCRTLVFLWPEVESTNFDKMKNVLQNPN